MSKSPGYREIDAAAHQSMTRFHNRTSGAWEPTSNDLPFARLLDAPLDGTNGSKGSHATFAETIAAASDGEDGTAGEYEIRQRIVGVKAFFQFLKGRAITPMEMFRQLTAVGRAIHEEPFNLMTMEEIAMMEGQSKAAHSWRCKLLSGMIELAGMKGSKLPGQKSKAASESYKQCRKGNTNRKGGKKGKRARQGSFLAKLKTSPPKRQQSFLRKLAVPKAPATAPGGRVPPATKRNHQ
ncbi:MAG: hypothetical protein ABMA13_16120 [Chthoniobacteraceae bacterium]